MKKILLLISLFVSVLSNAQKSGFAASTGADDFDAWTKIVVPGSITNTTQRDAVIILSKDIKVYSLWSIAELVNPVLGGTATSHALNLKSTSFNLTFNGGWTHASTGMTPNGTTGYATTGYVPATQHSNGLMSLGFYSRTNITSSTYCEMGVSNGAFNQNCAIWARANVGAGADIFYGFANTSGIATSKVANTDARGWFFASRTAAAVNYLQKNSTQTNFTETTGTPGTGGIYVGALNQEGTGAVFFSTKECAFVWVGASMTTAQGTTLFTIINRYETTLGRQN